ncbi:HisA/HisF-related TIM barrel protein, partial [uncultured Planktosalinus sp.]|uniref:HisA/HisF-related TIM barrel protein n=1 Tax=uncultured Planktosalinus sp. TaxID=1810935 RepID=UPI0030D7AA40
ESKGIQQVICTDISKDGMLQGPSFELYGEILKETTVQLIASGGVSKFDDLLKLRELGCGGVILGKAIYEGKITLKELEKLC